MKKTIKYVGLDVHKDTIQVAIAEEGRERPAMSYGNIHNTPLDIDKVIRKLKSSGHELSVVYEAGPTGYGIYRQLKAQNVNCAVVAPSLIPQKVEIVSKQTDGMRLISPDCIEQES